MNVLLAGSEAVLFGLEPLSFIIIMLVTGLILMAVEVFILPGFGVAGVLGILLLAGGSVTSWIYFGPMWGAFTVLGTIVLSIVLGIFVFKSRMVRRRFVLDSHLVKGGGTESEDLSRFIGSTGITKSDLRPAGIAVVDDTRLDVVSEGGFVEKGMQITVVAVDGPRVVVAKPQESKKEN